MSRQQSINQNQIEAFRLIMLRGTMTAAAEELHTSQPSISRLIADLEEKTGLRLFVRHAGRLRPTDAGIALYREVELSFIGLEKLTQTAHEIRLFGSGRLRLASAPVMALAVLPGVIKRFKDRYPGVMVSLEMRSEATIRRWTSLGYCDLGFPTGTPDVVGVRAEPLYDTAGVCALPAGHPLTRHKRIKASHLANVPLVLPSHADETRSALDRAFAQAGLQQMPSIETPYGATLCAMVSEGLGVGIVNPLAAAGGNWPNLVLRPFSPEIFFRGFAVYPDVHQDNVLVQDFVKIAREWIEEWLA